MAGKVRVYELARELGLSNKETIDLCEDLGIGVKSHSSSIVEAQADRVRRKADAEGLRREVRAEEPAEPAPAEPAAREDAGARKEPAERPAETQQAPAAATTSEGAGRAPRPPDQQPPAPPPSPRDRRLVTSRPASEQPDVAARAARPPAPPRSVPGQGRGGPEAPPAPAARAPRPAPPGGERPAPPHPPASGGHTAPPAGGGSAAPPPQAASSPSAPEQPAPPRSSSGKPIPPPPGPPRSSSGKPIPPPPGAGGRRQARPAPGGGGGGRSGPSSGPTGMRRMPSVPRGAVPGAGGRPGGGPGGPGRGGPPRRPRRAKRRRRNIEELQPQEIPTYTPEDAPVPEGEVIVERGSTPKDVGPRLNRSAADVVRFLMQQGEMVTATQSLSDDMLELFAAEIGAQIRLVDPGEEQEVELQAMLDVPDDDEDDGEDLPVRSPVITVMGHVDHGKTLLLDRIREANVVEGEAGGITQHIGAYQVDKDGRSVTFIDTPGHEAFTAMRARGADVTDIVILVVAADDGVMPQTIEALNHAKAAEVPIVVAINKVDRENADPNRVRQQLSEHDLVPEDWGGDTVMVEVSAMSGQGLDDLLANLLVVAELEDLRAEPDGRAMGVVLESHLDVGRGPVATVLVQRGTLRVGDPLVAGPAWGRVRALLDHRGEQVKEAGPSVPVEVLGLSDVAEAGDDFVVAPDDKTARTVGERREHYARVARTARDASVAVGGAKLEDIFEQIQRGETATLALILKADVNGSLEALTESLRKLERDEVRLAFVHRAVGGITENDVQLAAASNATIIGFNVRPDRKSRELAAAEEVEIRTYEIIYQVLEDIENAMVGMLEPEFEEVVTGEAEVREVFRVPNVGAVAGCYVQDGAITRGSKVRFLREGTIIWKGTVSSLKRFKDDAREVRSGFECGIGLSDFQDLKQGDIIETYEEREIPRT